ncbi:MAG: hypothetical protein V4598_09745 [Bdellovibrionota bacterium]
MDTSYTPSSQSSIKPGIPQLDREHGYFASATVTNSLDEIVAFCRDQQNVEKVLKNLPAKIENFLTLKLESSAAESEGHRIIWKNTGKTSGKLIFLLQPAPKGRGTVITTEAVFDKIHFREDGPSTLMNIFLKRMKQLMETGEIATVEGQPSGREEISPLKH